MVGTVAATLLLCCGLVIRGWHKHSARHTAEFHPPTVLAEVRPGVLRDRQRRVYPFSIIRGGAYSKEELIAALEFDPVAESHYQEFQRTQLRAVRSPFVKPVYLSYRKDNLIYWTGHPIRLHEGETLLTDGSLYARARCGNRISLVAQAPVALEEPLPSTLDLPEEIEAVPETLLKAAVEVEPKLTPMIGPEDFATPVSKPVTMFPPEGQIFGATIVTVLPMVGFSPVTPPPIAVVPVEFLVGSYPTPAGFVPPPVFKFLPPPGTPPDVTQPVPEPAGFVLVGVGVSAFLLVSLRRRYTRTQDQVQVLVSSALVPVTPGALPTQVTAVRRINSN